MSAAKMVTWKGEDDLHWIDQVAENGEIERVMTSGPSFMTWNKIRFEKDKPKLIDPATATTADEKTMFDHILKKTPNMSRFTVEDVKEQKAKAPEPAAEEEVYDDTDEDDDEADEPVHEGAHTRAKPKKRKAR